MVYGGGVGGGVGGVWEGEIKRGEKVGEERRGKGEEK